jgi:hypothetical protein
MINVGDDGKIADVCAVHEDGLKLYFSIQRSALSDRPKLSPQRTPRTQNEDLPVTAKYQVLIPNT